MFIRCKIDKKYLILTLVYLAGIAAPINQFKVPPMLPQIMAEFDISLSASGWLMSSFALAGFLFTLPSGFLLRKIGVKKMGIAALSLMIIGSLIGGTAGSALLLFLSRMLEGAGMALISVTAPVAISAWFPFGKRGISIGVWATWVPAGNIAVFIAAPHIGSVYWHHAWLFCTVYTVIMLVLFLFYFTMPQTVGKEAVQNAISTAPFRLGNIWKLALIFMLFNMVTISIKSYLPTFLQTFHGYSKTEASGVLVIMMACSIIAAPLAGFISDKIGSRKKVILSACVGASITALTAFTYGDSVTAYSLLFIGVAGGAMPAGIFTAVTELSKDPSNAGSYMSVIVFGQYMGMFGGPIFFSSIAEKLSWNTAAYGLFALSLAAFAVALRLKLK